MGPAMVDRGFRPRSTPTGRIVDWDYAVWSNTHTTRPGHRRARCWRRGCWRSRFAPPPPKPIPMPEGGGDRNSIPLYTLPNARVVYHFIPQMPLRVSAMRSLGGYMNVFAIESFMDELARAAGADPVAFRLRHLRRSARPGGDRRAPPKASAGARRSRRPATAAASRSRATRTWRPIARSRLEVAVEHETGRTRLVRAVAAVDSGQAVNPDGIRNQIEGAILQSASWTLYESAPFDAAGMTSLDWCGYPILRFDAVPDSVEVHVVDRPGQPFLGAGECGQGPAAAAIANALADATGQRLRDLPLSREKVKAAIGV